MKKTKLFFASINLFMILMSSSCSSKKDEFKSDIKNQIKEEFLNSSKDISNVAPENKWWLEFNDEVLNNLIDLGLKNNKDIQIANMAIITSRQLNNIEAAALMPTVSATASRQRFANPAFGPNGVKYDLFQATFDAAWELDFLGKNLDRYKAGKLRFLKDMQLYKASALRITSEISQNYIEMKSLQKQISDLEKIVKIQEKLNQIVIEKEKEGRGAKTAIHNSEINLNLAKTQLLEARTGEKIYNYKLATLIGETPQKISEILANPSKKEISDYYSGIVPVGLQSDILRRRPDIVAAEYEIDAAVLDKRAQFKEFFPSFTLTAKIGGGAKDLGDVFKNGANVKDIRGGISMPIFQAGSLMAQYKISKTKAKIAVLNYEKTVIAAIEECESQLLRYINSLEVENNSQATLQASAKIYKINQNKKSEGAISHEQLLLSEISNLNNDIAFVQKKSSSLTNLIALHKAIGGGFEGYEMRFEKDRVVWVSKCI